MPPPRTLKPVAPSLGVWTPGIIWMTRMMSVSPIRAGSFLTMVSSTRSRPIWGIFSSSRLLLEKTVAASRVSLSVSSRKSSLVGPLTVTVLVAV